MRWLLISSQIKKEKHRKFYCFHNTSRWHFLNQTLLESAAAQQNLCPCQHQGSTAEGPRICRSGHLRHRDFLRAFPRGSLPPSTSDKFQPKQCPEPRGLVALCLLDPPWDCQVLLIPNTAVSMNVPKLLIFHSHHLCTHLQMSVRLHYYLCRS